MRAHPVRYSLILALICCMGWLQSAAQASASGDLYDYIVDIINNLPGADGDDYSDPTTDEGTKWQQALATIGNGEYATAHGLLQDVGYQLTEFTDTESAKTYLIIEKTASSDHYWGTYVFNPAACRRELIIMSPHAKKDLNTGKQGIYCYTMCDALGFMLAGTNRCNAPDASSCSGTTTVCNGESAAYRKSDLAHSTESIWQHTVDWLKSAYPATYLVQLHGFAKLESDPYVIMSNGTRQKPSPDKIAEVRDHLDIVDPVLTFKVAHEDLSWTRLIGFTNTNGRLLNNSVNPCSNSADEASGRFLHIEQEKTRLRQDISGWNKMARALAASFRGAGCPAVIPVDDHDVWYVLPEGVGDGRSWSQANGYLRGVLHLADAGDTVKIGAGTYLPTLYDDPDETLDLYQRLTILGGYPGTGGSDTDRDWTLHQTIISGDLGVSGDTSDNSICVIRGWSLPDTVILDGTYLQYSVSPFEAGISILAGTGQLIFRNVAVTDMYNPVVLQNNQKLLLEGVTIVGNPSLSQVLIMNAGTLQLHGVELSSSNTGKCIVNSGVMIDKTGISACERQ